MSQHLRELILGLWWPAFAISTVIVFYLWLRFGGGDDDE